MSLHMEHRILARNINRQKKPSRGIAGSIICSVFNRIFGNFRRKDLQCQEFVKRLIISPFFKIFMITVITCDAIFIVLWTDYETKYHLFRLYEVSQIFIIAVYGVELFLKLYVDPVGYWANGYNLLDICIMFIISIPYTMINFKGLHYPYLNIGNGLQSLRVLKLISYSRGIRTLIKAMGQTIYTVNSVLALLFVLMFIFAVLGFCLFGVSDGGDVDNWGNLAVAFFTLFSLTTVDSWTDLQRELDDRNFVLSRAFTILFILLATFIFLSMFVGVMIIHTQDSIKKFEYDLMLERHMKLMEEKQVILKKQQEKIIMLMQSQKNADYASFSDLVKNFKKTLQHNDPMVLDDFGTSFPFIDVYLTTLDNQDTTIYKLQELYYEIVNVLSLMLEELNANQQPQPENQQPQHENQEAQAENQEPQLENLQPQPENQQPQPENQQPQPENQQPQPENQQPQPENHEPQPENQEPQPETQQPQPENQQLQPENQEPQPENQEPQPENQQSQHENRQPQPENQQPQPENQQPQPENQQPQPENQQPQPENQQPQPENQQPQPENQQPQPENQQPQPENQQPQPENQQPQPEKTDYE
ncbi:cation channel sperm-associated protein 3-like [Erinaceus europaeus]|uniref:Cation channel sperm-associated protein 3-like n=1 Tax=Erinaceus europaeus TaxID=9365 RepID=A0ABM3X0M6_ERIEU|nr:cation channel sperm-associated protein 3-like [Erinaceus europaeus]